MTRTPYTGGHAVPHDFPRGGGETARLIRQRDWSSTPVGPIDRWPETLRMSLQNALSTTFPISILWGEDFLQFYNDVYATIMMGDKHPTALGRPVRENWPDFWPDIKGPLERVIQRGGPIHQQETSLFVDKQRVRTEVYFSFSFAPIYEPDGDVAGVLVSVVDTTERVIHRRRLHTLGKLGLALSRACTPDDVLQSTVEALEYNDRDIPCSLLFAQTDPGSIRAELVASTGITPDTTWSPSWIELPSESGSTDPIAQALDNRESRLIDLDTELGPRPDPRPHQHLEQGLIVPVVVGSSTDGHPVGAFLFGINPDLKFDTDYRHFLEEIGRDVAISYDNALAKERELDAVRARAELARQRIETGQLKDRARLIDTIEQPLYAVDRDWRVVYANSTARKDPHWVSRKLVGQRLFDVVPIIDDSPSLRDAFHHTMTTGELSQIEFTSPINERIYDIRAFRWADGIAVAFRDISERRRAQQALKRTQARFQAVVEASTDVIAITDASGDFTFCSPAAEPVLGIDSDALVGTSLFDLLSDDGASTARSLYDELTRTPGDTRKFQVPFRRRFGDDDQDCWLSIQARNLTEHNGIEGMLLNIRDITDIKNYEAKLVAAKERAEEITRLKSSILTNMSHEIRTPLTSIIGMASVLSRQVSDSEAELARKIERSGMRLGQTLDSVFTLAKIEGEAYDLQSQDIDLADEIDDAVQSLQKLADDKDLTLQFEAISTPTVRTDPSFVTSILNNLIGNAIKFTETGTVTVRLREDRAQGIIEVEDTGIGIDENFLPHIFEEFRQESTGLARSHGGAGLGLTIAKRMTESMNGQLTVLSTRDVATTFTLALPKKTPDSNTASASSQSMAKTTPDNMPSTSRPAVLIVEDDESIRFMLQQLLGDDFRPIAVGDAESAIESASEQDFELILLDIGLPEMDGIEALRHLRQIPGYQNRPIVAITGYALPDDKRRVADQEFSAYIAKPFDPDELLEQLLQLVEN